MALFWYQLFSDNEDFLSFMLTEQKLNGVSKARLLARLQLHFNKTSPKDPQSLESRELNHCSPYFTSKVYFLMARFGEGFAALQKQVHAGSPRFSTDSGKIQLSRVTLADPSQGSSESPFPQKMLLTK